MKIEPKSCEPGDPSRAASKTRSPRWSVWATVLWLTIIPTIFVVLLIGAIASYNDNKALAELSTRIIVILLITGVAFNVVTFSVLLWHGWSNRPNLPSFSKDEMLFDEKSAGGYSLLSWHTRRSPAKNGIHVSIARDQLWIRPRFFPFVSIGLELDQVHQIPLAAVEEVIVDQRGSGKFFVPGEFDITYRSSDGRSHSVRLWIRKHEEFFSAIRTHCHQARVSTQKRPLRFG